MQVKSIVNPLLLVTWSFVILVFDLGIFYGAFRLGLLPQLASVLAVLITLVFVHTIVKTSLASKATPINK